MFNKIATFLREVRAEISKVSWPSRDEIIGSTFVVLAVTIIISVFIGVIDLGINKILLFVIMGK